VGESEIESKVCEYAKIKGIAAYKFTSPNRKNVPDRLFLCPGTFTFFIEFKATGEEPSAAQVREINRLINMGYVVYVIDDVKIGKKLIDEIYSTYISTGRNKLH